MGGLVDIGGGKDEPVRRPWDEETLPVAQAVGAGVRLKNYVFTDCTILGPAVVFPLRCHFSWGCSFEPPVPERLFWTLPEIEGPATLLLVGLVYMDDCIFERCTFVEIGLAGDAEMVSQWREDYARGLLK